MTEDGTQRLEDRILKSACDELSRIEVGPVVVPGGRDYAAASMRKLDDGKSSQKAWC